MRPTDFEIEVPEVEGDDPKEVYAFVGLALYSASVLEAELINFAVGLRASLQQKQLYREELETWFTENEAKTFGALAAAIRKLTELPATVEELVVRALKARNRLAHSYFRDNAESFLSSAGRRKMLEGLRADIRLFADADRALTELSMPLWPKLGVPDDFFAKEFAAMKARAASRDEV